MPKCSFCKKVYEFPRGLTLALNDGVVLHFCSSKCRKNWKMGRKSQKTEWVRKMKHAEEELVKEIKEEASEKEEKKEKKEEKAQEKKTEKQEEKTEEKKEEKAEKK